MKKSFVVSALLLLLGSTVFAAGQPHPKAVSAVQFSSLPGDKGFGLSVAAEKSELLIYNQDKQVIFKDRVSNGAAAEKGYILSNLENGDYTVEVRSSSSDISRQLHIYDEGALKSFVFLQ